MKRQEIGHRFVLRICALVPLLLGWQPVFSHHASAGIYDKERLAEIEGTVVSAEWRNPHCTFVLRVIDESGESLEWEIESGSVSTLRVRGLDREFLVVGDNVRVAGELALDGRPAMFARNMLLQNGREVLLTAESDPFWPEGLRGELLEPDFDEVVADRARSMADGIFRVWSADLDPFVPMFRADEFPLTAAAQQARERWDPLTSPFLGCEQKSLPLIMGGAYPIEFLRAGENILLRLEEFDTERLIHMTDAAPSQSFRSRMGYSTGYWEQKTLVVETTNLDLHPFFFDGTPRSSQATLVERFTVGETGDNLFYTALARDPEAFSEPLELSRYWLWRPEIQVQPFDCIE